MNSGSFRMTAQRRTILEEIRKVKTHPTADEIYEMVRRRLPHISLGTVYRNLQVLSVQKLEYGNAQSRFDGNAEPHHHVRCTSCGRVDDMVGVSVELSTRGLPEPAEYEISGYRLEFLGICPGCRRSKKKDSGNIVQK